MGLRDNVMNNKEKVIIYGTGGSSSHFVKVDFNKDKFELVAFCDSDCTKWGHMFLEKKIVSPLQLSDMQFDKIIIASVFVNEITDKLVDNYQIERTKIVNKYYREIEEIKKRYCDFYRKKGKITKSATGHTIKSTDKIVICTAIAGGYDELRDPLYIDERCEYICYTDNPNLKSNIWKIRSLDIYDNDYNRSAKRIKVLPHLFFAEYDWSIWIDGKFQITGDIVSLIDRYALNSNFLSFMHYKRNSVFEDAKAVIEVGFDKEEIIKEQIEKYKKEGFTDDNELIEGGILFRKHNDNNIIRLMNRWWKEISEHSRRDQVSFNYSAWKEDVFCDMIDLNIYDNEYVKVYPHNRKEK